MPVHTTKNLPSDILPSFYMYTGTTSSKRISGGEGGGLGRNSGEVEIKGGHG